MRKIRILFIHYQLVCGGAEQALFDQISLLNKSVFDVTVLALYGHGEWEAKFKEAGIHVVNVLQRRQKNWNPISFMRHQFRKSRVLYHLKKDPEGLINFLFPEGMDIVVSYSMWESDEIGFTSDTKSIRYIHGDMKTNAGCYESVMRIRDSLCRYNRIICVSEMAAQSFREITGVSENVCVHYNPLNSDNVRMLAQEPLDLPMDLPIICAVGRLAPEKGYERLIRIHKKLWDKGVHHRLVIVGDGPLMEVLKQIVRETETQDTVLLAGYQKNPYPYMRKSRFLVCSSYTEGLPVTVMESLSMGIPVVSALPSIAEVFGDEACGIITENDDASLENGINKMLTEDQFYDQIKLAAQRRSGCFDGSVMIRDIEKEYFEVLGDHSA